MVAGTLFGLFKRFEAFKTINNGVKTLCQDTSGTVDKIRTTPLPLIETAKFAQEIASSWSKRKKRKNVLNLNDKLLCNIAKINLYVSETIFNIFVCIFYGQVCWSLS